MNSKKTIACPFCKAAVGASCVNKDGTVFKAGVHMARWYETKVSTGMTDAERANYSDNGAHNMTAEERAEGIEGQ